MNQLSAKQKSFYKEIARILWEEWDPIGVNDGENDWEDEYDRYVPHIYKLAISNADTSKIAKHLSSVVIQNIRVASNPKHDSKVAKLIVDIKVKMFSE